MLPNFLVSRATWLFFHRSLPQSSRVENVAVSLTRKFEHAQKEKKSIVFRSCPFSSPQPAVFWSRGLETRGSHLCSLQIVPSGSGTGLAHSPSRATRLNLHQKKRRDCGIEDGTTGPSNAISLSLSLKSHLSSG